MARDGRARAGSGAFALVADLKDLIEYWQRTGTATPKLGAGTNKPSPGYYCVVLLYAVSYPLVRLW